MLTEPSSVQALQEKEVTLLKGAVKRLETKGTTLEHELDQSRIFLEGEQARSAEVRHSLRSLIFGRSQSDSRPFLTPVTVDKDSDGADPAV